MRTDIAKILLLAFVAVLVFPTKSCGEDRVKFSFSWSMQRFHQQNGRIAVYTNGFMSVPIGSGFVFGPNDDVVTCKHVMDGAADVFRSVSNLVYCAGNEVYFLTPKLVLTNHDIAVFSTSPKMRNTDPFVLGDFEKLTVGSGVAYVGFDTRAERPLISAETIVAKEALQINGVSVDYLDFRGIAIPGYSGGGVFNSKGEIVAIITQGGHDDRKQVINRAVSLSALAEILTNAVESRP